MKTDEGKALRLDVSVDRGAMKDVPSTFSNYAEVLVGQEETYLLFCLRDDMGTVVEGDEAKVTAKPLQTIIITSEHARRLADSIHTRLEAVDKLKAEMGR